MVKINENEAILSKEDLRALIGTAMALTLDSYDMTEKMEMFVMGCAAEVHNIIDGHIWGAEKILEIDLDLAKRITRIHDEIYNPAQDPGPAGEDKQAICRLLLAVLQKTRAYHDLVDLKYEPHTVMAEFAGGGIHQINVEADSGIAMINDILAHI